MSDPLFAVFAETLEVPAGTLTDDSTPDNTRQWDSLKAMDLVSALEDAFDVAFTTPEIMQMQSIGHARRILKQKGVENV